MLVFGGHTLSVFISPPQNSLVYILLNPTPLGKTQESSFVLF